MSEASSRRRTFGFVVALTFVLAAATSAMATERVITIYFHGTGGSLGGPQTALVDLYFNDASSGMQKYVDLEQCQVDQWSVLVREVSAPSGQLNYKYSVEGFGTGLIGGRYCVLELGNPDLGLRNWNVVKDEALKAIRAVLAANDSSDTYVLNLVGHSRGGAMALRTARATADAADLDRITRINILAYDPVPGSFDPILKFGDDFKLSAIVDHYVGIYAMHDRRLMFEPIIPYEESSSTKTWMVMIPGSHTDLVWTRPEHKAVGLAIGERLLHSPGWGDVPVTPGSEVTDEGTFSNALVAMYKNYDYFGTEEEWQPTGFPWILGCHPDGMIRATTPAVWRNFSRRLAFVAPKRHEPHWGFTWPWECGAVYYNPELVFWLDEVKGLHPMETGDWATLQFMRGVTSFAAPPPVTMNTGPSASSCDIVIDDGTLGTATGPVTNIARNGVPPGNLFPVGTTTVTWMATDLSGDKVTAPQYVTVVDDTPPMLIAPAAVTMRTGPSSSSCDALVSDTEIGLADATASENCAGEVTITHNGIPAGNRFPVGTTTLGYTARDARGNEAMAEQTVTVIDDTPPMIAAPPPVTVGTGPGTASCGVVIDDVTLGTATATDNCSNLAVERSGVPDGNSFPIGTTTLTWSVTDHAGNTSLAHQMVTVVDTTPPALSVPAAVTVYSGATTTSCDVVISDEQLGVADATATDNCGATINVVHTGIPAGNRFPVGTTTLLYTAIDERGNEATAQQTVTVVDNTPPVIAAPPAVTLETGPLATSCGLVIEDSTLGTATASDNCPNLGSVKRSGAPAGNFFPVGTTTLTWSVTDQAGNEATALQTVTVVDATAPTIAPPRSLTVSTGPEGGSCGVVIDDATIGMPAIADNCPGLGPVVRSGLPPGNFFPVGTTTLTWTVTDHAGNQAASTQTVTVIDATPPTISAVSPTPSVLWPANHQWVNVSVGYGAVDDCGQATCALTVSSNEPVDGTGDGDTAPDWQIVNPHQVRLRAERAGTGPGRIYTIAISCSDAAGTTSSASTTVIVPRNQGGK